MTEGRACSPFQLSLYVCVCLRGCDCDGMNRDKEPSVFSGLEFYISTMAERGKKKHNDWTMLQPSHMEHPGHELHLSSNKFSVRCCVINIPKFS